MSIRNQAHLRKVEDLAREVASLAKLTAERLDEEVKWNGSWHLRPYPGPRLTGELRRRSMDLTRALADLRRAEQ